MVDATSGALVDTGREEDRRVFFGEHLDQCRACRDEMIDHANQLALSEIAREGRVEVGSVIGQLGETAKQLCEFARDQDIPFEEVILGILHGRRYRAANSKPRREVPSVASTEA